MHNTMGVGDLCNLDRKLKRNNSCIFDHINNRQWISYGNIYRKQNKNTNDKLGITYR